MKKFDAAHPVWNRILGVVYLPLVFVCSLGGMMGEAVMYETDPLVIAAWNLPGWGLTITALTTYPALFFSGKCFSEGKQLKGHLLRWYPILMFIVLNALHELLIFLSRI